MNNKELSDIFKKLKQAKVDAHTDLKNTSLTRDQLESAIIYYKNVFDNYKHFYNDHSISGELIDLSGAIDSMEERLKQI